jgi:hypothetical protein
LEPKKEMFGLKMEEKEEVIHQLKAEQKIAPDHEGLEACIRYITNRKDQFDYAAAKAHGLSIGSGKVESTHRSLIQRRLKIPGA